MNTTHIRNQDFGALFKGVRPRRGFTFGVIILCALIAFELFNYSTTEYALRDLLGDLKFVGIHWSTILALAFCGIDFAGIARLFTPEVASDQHQEVWYLFGAWLLAATMNALLTWWGVSLAILDHQSLGNQVLARQTLLHATPVFVAVLVWFIRILIIGSFSVSGNRLFSQGDAQGRQTNRSAPTQTATRTGVAPLRPPASAPLQATPRDASRYHQYSRSEPAAQSPLSMSASSHAPSEKNPLVRR
ncbi:MAG: hypothetical protein PHS96_12870 [Anaerolineales bacterium]|nr:hypothetical protein [Anaerolineales bacterium]